MQYLHARIALLAIATTLAFMYRKEVAFLTVPLLIYYLYRLVRFGNEAKD